jgi:hypothetical protein
MVELRQNYVLVVEFFFKGPRLVPVKSLIVGVFDQEKVLSNNRRLDTKSFGWINF